MDFNHNMEIKRLKDRVNQLEKNERVMLLNMKIAADTLDGITEILDRLTEER